MAEISAKLKLYKRRARLLYMERSMLFGGCAGFIAASVMVLLESKYEWLINYLLWALVVAAGILAGFIYGLFIKIDNKKLAYTIDKRAGFKERISSAAYLEGSSNIDGIEAALIGDAEKYASSSDPKEIFPHKFALTHWLCLASLLIFICVTVLPQLPMFQSAARRQEVKVMKREGKHLEKVAKTVKKDSSDKDSAKKIAAKMLNTAKRLQTGRMTKKQALLATRKLSKQIKNEQDRLAKRNTSSKSMEKAVSEMRKNSQNLAKEMAQKIADKQNIPPDEALEKVPSDKHMAELARKEGPLTKKEETELKKAIEKYADQKSNKPMPKELGEALAKLAANKDYKNAMNLMQKLTKKLNSGNMSKQDKEMLQKQMQQLANALKNTDLDKMAKQMLQDAKKLISMKPEDLDKLIKQAKMRQKLQKACSACNKASLGLGLCNGGSCSLSMSGSGKGGTGDGSGGDDSNSGPKGKLKEVKDISKAPSNFGNAGNVFSVGETQGAPDTKAPSSIPYSQVLPNYKKAAESALTGEKVPPPYKSRVKDYFQSLE